MGNLPVFKKLTHLMGMRDCKSKSEIFCGIFAMIAAGPIWGSICGKKYMIQIE